MCALDAYTGPYLQQSYLAVLVKIRQLNLTGQSFETADFNLVDSDSFEDLLRLAAQYPEVTNAAFRTAEPAGLLNYLYKLSLEITKATTESPAGEGNDQLTGVGEETTEVEGDEKEDDEEEDPAEIHAEAALYTCLRLVLENGMRLLRIAPLEVA